MSYCPRWYLINHIYFIKQTASNTSLLSKKLPVTMENILHLFMNIGMGFWGYFVCEFCIDALSVLEKVY